MSDNTLLIILGNQLFEKKYLSQAKTKNIFMAEDFGLCTEEKYHKQKIFFFLSAMRCFKDEVSDLGYKVFYNKLSDKNKRKLILKSSNLRCFSVQEINLLNLRKKKKVLGW